MLTAAATTAAHRRASRSPGALSPVALRDIELREPLAPIVLEREYVGLYLLVRIGGGPIGVLRIADTGREIPVTRLRAALDAQLGVAVLRSVWRAQVDDAAPIPVAQPAISVVVCTRDRTASLAVCLDSLLAVEYPRFEIIIVDNAPTGESTATLVQRRIAERAGVPRSELPTLRYVREMRAGLDWARNRGLQESRCDIVAYTDDDVRVDAAWLRGIAQGFRDPDVQLVTGLVVPAELETDAQAIFEDHCGGMGKGMLPQLRVGAQTGAAADRLGAHHLGVGANMAFRRAWLQRLGGFDTALDVGTPSHGGGDLDIFHRTLLAGGTTRYEPRAFVRHHHRRNMPALRRQLRDNGRAFGVYLLSRWAVHERPRLPVLRYAVGTWLRWLVSRVVQRLLGRDKLSIRMQAEEWRGLLAAPFAWRATYARDRQVRRHERRVGGGPDN